MKAFVKTLEVQLLRACLIGVRAYRIGGMRTRYLHVA